MEQTLEHLRKETAGVLNTTTYFMRRAEKHALQGEMKLATACLILLCEKIDNYEESLEFYGLSEKWQTYRYLVEGLVKPSIPFNSLRSKTPLPLPPQECTIQISDILALPEDELLSAMSEHLGELSGSGAVLNYLNKWERTAYYADELLMNVNSGGFDSYLYYHGMHFEKAYNAMEMICATTVLDILNSVRAKFPRNRIPKTEEALQNTMDDMEQSQIDFEEEDDRFYCDGEKNLLKQLLLYILDNKKHFR